jgi:periplasmic glucans biosynthesis protein
MDAKTNPRMPRLAAKPRAGIVISLGAAAIGLAPLATSGAAVTFESLCRQAQEQAKRAFVPPADDLPQSFKNLNYDRYRAIEYRPEQALWRGEGLPFEVEFFHRGYLFPKRVRIFILDGERASEVSFSPRLFDYSKTTVQAQQVPQDLGFAGFRLLRATRRPAHYQEFISFLGASYFRAIGASQVYGASARGLAVGMGSPNEEFPFFDAFWIEKPPARARTITVYALLDSVSLTGAYRFGIRPGVETVVDVRAEIFARATLDKVGVAPLTSMYFYGLNGPKRLQDKRPEVHDSDGLLIANGSTEWIWRPLWNPKTLSLSTFQVESVKGFGLMQRQRDPNSYNDSKVLYEKRPSIWVEPVTSWRGGAVRLLELPSNGEGQDNLGACWVPPANVRVGNSFSIEYRLHFGRSAGEPARIAKVVSTRWFGSGQSAARFDVDFDPGQARRDPQPAPEAVVSATGGRVTSGRTRLDPSGKYWRVTFEATPEPGRIMEIRVFLRQGGRRVTEVWSFAWPR